MKKISPVLWVCVLLLSACVTAPVIPDRATDESMMNFLPYLNQKVAGYLDANQPIILNTQTYKEIVKKVCDPLPSCSKNAAVMFDTYSVQARTVDDIFSVMLCDKKGSIKIMEDFSCNEQKVEIVSFRMKQDQPCKFEDNWKEEVRSLCPDTK